MTRSSFGLPYEPIVYYIFVLSFHSDLGAENNVLIVLVPCQCFHFTFPRSRPLKKKNSDTRL